MGKWWLFGSQDTSLHGVQLDQAHGWPAAMVSYGSQRFQPETPYAAPPGWYDGNVPASGAWIPIPVYYLDSKRTLEAMNLQPIGPVNQDMQRGAALQAALAATLRGLQTQQGG